MHLSLKGSLKSSLIFTYVKTDQVLDLGNLEPFTIPDLSGNANTATLYSGIYVTTNGTTDKAIGADATALGSGNYYLTGKIKPAGTTAKTTMNGSTASNLTGLTAGVWQDFQTATASAITPSSINLGWDGTAFNATVDNWSDVKLHDASDDSVVAHYKLYDSADASLDGYPALDCVGGYHGAHVGCAGGSGEPDILQTAGEDFNKRMWFDGVNDDVNTSLDVGAENVSALDVRATVMVSQAATGVIQAVVTQNNGGAPADWVFELRIISTGEASFACITNGSPGTFSSVVGTTVLQPNVKYDLRGYWDGATKYIYVNGALENSNAQASIRQGAQTSPVNIGNRKSTGVPFNGIIYDVFIADESATLLEIAGTGNTDAGWIDTSGNGNNGTVNGSPSLYHVAESETTAGQDALGNAIENPRPNERVLNLTTETGYAEIADNDSLDLGTSSLVTHEFWIKIEDGSVNHRIIDKATSVNGIGLQYISSISSIRVTIKTQSNSSSTWDGATDIADGQWHNIIVRLNNRQATPVAGDVSIFIDSADDSATLFASASNLTATLTNAEPLYIGFSNEFPTQKLVGQIGDVRQYDRALTADEVLKNYNARKGAYGL
jgi:hypothetical protein